MPLNAFKDKLHGRALDTIPITKHKTKAATEVYILLLLLLLIYGYTYIHIYMDMIYTFLKG